MKGFIIMFFILTIALSACKEEPLPNLNGTYTGRFIYRDPTGAVIATATTSVTFTNTSYTSSRGQNRIPAGGSGSFERVNSKTMKFNDVNVWTTEFDPGLILNGNYNCQVAGDSLFMTKYIKDFKAYEYRLKRNNN